MRAVIFDLDGTICDPSGRLYHLDGEKDWKSFHAAAGDDTPIDPIVQLVRMLFKAAEAGDGLDAVLIVTARHDEPNYEQITRDWLEIEEVPFHRLYMRKDADTRPDHVVKEEILQQIIDDEIDGEEACKSFPADAGDDPPIDRIVQLVRMLFKAAEAGDGLDAVLIVTARHDEPNYEQITRDWLEIEEVPFHRLYMRKDADTRPDHVVKEEILQQIIDDGYQPILAVDDRPSVVAMWRSKGITTLHCAPDEPGSSIYAGQTLLHMLVGPCGAGKSTYAEKQYLPHEIFTTDVLLLNRKSTPLNYRH